MKAPFILFFATIVVVCFSCQKKMDVIPVAGKVDSVSRLSDSIPFTSYTDTFYGNVYQGDYSPPGYFVGNAYVYASYSYLDSKWYVGFSSDYRGTGYEYDGGFSGAYAVDSTNYYTSVIPMSEDDTWYLSFQLIKDSLYYNESEFIPPTGSYTYFAGYRISKYHPHR